MPSDHHSETFESQSESEATTTDSSGSRPLSSDECSQLSQSLTRFSSVDLASAVSAPPAWNRPQPSLSEISVVTAEPIYYFDLDASEIECDFRPPEETQSDCSSGKQLSPYPRKHLVPGNPLASSGEYSSTPSRQRLVSQCDVECVLQNASRLKVPASYYHVMEMNLEPVDMATRYSKLASHYQVDELCEFSTLDGLRRRHKSPIRNDNDVHGLSNWTDSVYYDRV